jgi:uncharacterized protein YndB with AHSA1/START domain
MIHKSILLRCPPADAFHLFTERISEWWPPSHRPTKDPHSQIFLERSGRFWERARDEREADLGRVLVWDEPLRLVLDFYLGTNQAQPTEVEITFVPEDEGTRVTVQHRAKPESQDLWNARATVFEKSWDAVLFSLANR